VTAGADKVVRDADTMRAEVNPVLRPDGAMTMRIGDRYERILRGRGRRICAASQCPPVGNASSRFVESHAAGVTLALRCGLMMQGQRWQSNCWEHGTVIARVGARGWGACIGCSSGRGDVCDRWWKGHTFRNFPQELQRRHDRCGQRLSLVSVAAAFA